MRRTILAATLISAGIAAWYLEPSHLLSVGILLVTSVVLVVLHERLRRAARINEQLRESEERFRLMIDEAPIGMALVALDNRLMRVNRVLCDIVGYSPEELETLTVRDLTHPDDIEIDLALAIRLARGEIPRYQLEKRYFRKDGAIVDAMLSVSLLRDRDGNPLYYIAQVEDITERKRADAWLRDSEQRLGLALDAAQMGMWDLDLVTDVSVRSLRHDQIFGYASPAPTWGTKLFMEHVVPEDVEGAKRAFAVAFETGKFEMECRIYWPDSSVHWISALGRVFHDARGEPVRMLGTVRDITQSKCAAEALQRRELEFRSLAESMPQIVWVTTADGLNAYCNQRWVDYTGLSLEQSAGDGWITPVHPDDRQRAWALWRRAIEHREAYSLECRLRSAEGCYRWWLVRGVPVIGAHGEIVKWFGTCTDIEAIKRIEKEQQFLAEAGAVLSASLDYEQTLAAVAELVVRDFADWCAVDVAEPGEPLRRLKVVSSNPANAELCRFLEGIAIDRSRNSLLRTVVETKEPILVAHVTPEQVEANAQSPEHLRALRAMNPLSMMGLPLLRKGQLLGVLVFVSSTPSRIYGHDDLRVAEALAERAAGAIENARLYAASVQAAQIRDQVLGFVAHDLRNPLGAILMQASLLRRRGPEPERRSQKPVEAIQRAGSRMSRLIQDILDVTRMEYGRLPIDRGRVATAQVVIDAVEAQKSFAAAAALDLLTDVEADISDVWADRDRVLQIFENLISNAIRFTQPGGHITVGATAQDGHVVFSIGDTGAGLTVEELAHVFDRFWQAQKAKRGGAGLGLQICKGIVDAHGGHIWVESTLGVGTTFHFTLPTAQSAGAHPTEAEVH